MRRVVARHKCRVGHGGIYLHPGLAVPQGIWTSHLPIPGPDAQSPGTEDLPLWGCLIAGGCCRGPVGRGGTWLSLSPAGA